ncbi:MAG: hydrogenase maturation nickel metallochaperone HypA [Francisellaceae bacterium]
MHELSLCRHLIQLVEKQLEDVPVSRVVEKVMLRCGSLAVVDVSAMSFWFPVVTESTRLKGARLEIVEDKAMARCGNCDLEFTIKSLIETCPFCQNQNLEITKGRELTLTGIELKGE